MKMDTATVKSLRDALKSADPKRLKKINLTELYSQLTGRPFHPIWNPLPGPQSSAYDSSADEIFFGGAAGGGKSELLIGLALTAHTRSLFLRRDSTQLDAAVQRIKEIVGNNGLWRNLGNGGVMRIGRRRIEMHGCEHEDDKRKFQGRPHDFYALDEICHFSRTQFQFIIGWNRSENPNQKCRVIVGGNPPDKPEDRWIIEEWAPWLEENYPDPALPGELRWYTTIDEKLTWFKSGTPFKHKGETITPRSRTFIRALLEDNPILEATGYRAVLQRYPEPYRSQMLFGDMNAGTQDHEYQVIPTEWIRIAQKRWEEGPPEGFSLTALGVDIARGGGDCTVISPRYNNWFSRLTKVPGKSTPDGPTSAALIQSCYSGEDAYINIDVSGGFGGSPYDILKQLYGSKVKGINFAEGTELKDKTGKIPFTNVRAGMYWSFREALDPVSGQNLALPPDPELLADLTAPRYKMLATGIQIEPKDKIIQRIGRSPDKGDAIVLALWRVKKKELNIW